MSDAPGFGIELDPAVRVVLALPLGWWGIVHGGQMGVD